MFGTLFFCKIIFPKKFPKSFSCRFRKKAVPLHRNLKKNTAMRKSFILLMACLVFSATRAQTIAYPALPNEVCAKAWNNYRKADVLWKTGWGLFISGAVGTTACSIGTIATLYKHEMTPAELATNRSCFSLAIVSCGVLAASVPCLIVGQVRRKNSMRTINEYQCAPDLTCDELRLSYKRANDTWKAGWGLFGSGLGLLIVGISLTFTENNTMLNAGLGLISIGSGAVITSVPCLAFGQVQRKSAAKQYHQYCADQPPLTFSLQTSSNGLGIAMNF